MTDWDARFMALAVHVGTWSKDRSRKVGCVIISQFNGILAIGYNGFVRGSNDGDETRHERPQKYLWTEHAERNAIYSAAATGIALRGSRMYLPWFPCPECARAIVQSGIAELVALEPDHSDPTWGANFRVSEQILNEGGVRLRLLAGI